MSDNTCPRCSRKFMPTPTDNDQRVSNYGAVMVCAPCELTERMELGQVELQFGHQPFRGTQYWPDEE